MNKENVKRKDITKKLFCLFLIMVMLAGNFITPIKILADEQSTNVAESSEETENENGAITSEEQNEQTSSSNTSNGQTSSNQTKNENTQASNNESEINQSNNQQNGASNNTNNSSLKANSVLNSTINLFSNAKKQSNNQANNSENNSANNLSNNAANNSKTENLPQTVKPVTKENLQKEEPSIKIKNDQYEINQFKTEFVSGATEDENKNLVWTPANSATGHEFTFRVNYAISGLKELPAESIQITIPKSILRNKEANFDDYYVMSLPSNEEYDGTTELAYIEYEDYLVIYNPAEVPAGINGYFEIAYATKSTTFNYKDYDPSNTETIKNGGTASDPFYAIITVKANEEETLANISDDKNVFINTTAKITSTQKRYPTLYRTWNTSWMEQTPEDSDEYYYLVWEIRSYIQKDPTQKYNFTLEDVVTDLTEGTDGTDYEIVGYKLAGERYYSDKNTQTNLTQDEYRYDYVLTRHKISTYKDIEYTLKNTVTAIVDPVDQVDSDTKATSSNTFFWDPSFTPPTGHFNLFKYGNNNWYSRFNTYWDYANYDLDKLQKQEVTELNGFKYFTETIGYAYPWTLKEGGSSDNPEDYGVNPVTYDTWDDKLYLENDETPLNYEDYYLEYRGLLFRIFNIHNNKQRRRI